MSKTLEIFEHRGVIGATSDLDNGTFINDPTGTNQLGVVVDVKHVCISPEAKGILSRCEREGGSFAPVMLTSRDDGSHSVCFLGFRKHMVPGVMIGRTCQRAVLEHIEVVSNPVPEDFKKAVDNYLNSSERH